jgi:D-alanine-D-alanine ligase-like ATP-grasp enzyme
LKEVFSTVPLPAIVKPNNGSSMWGVIVVNNFAELKEAVEYLISQNQDVLVEKLVKGIPVSCFVFEHNNLLHTHIKIHSDDELSKDILTDIRNESLYIHNCLAYKHHAEYDFLVTPKGLVFLELNSHPSLTSGYIDEVFKKGIVKLKDYIASKI